MSDCCCEFPWEFTNPTFLPAMAFGIVLATGSSTSELQSRRLNGGANWTKNFGSTGGVVESIAYGRDRTLAVAHSGTIKLLGQDGSEIWSVLDTGAVPRVARGTDGSVYVVSGSPTRTLRKRANSDGAVLWSVAVSAGARLAVDSDDVVYSHLTSDSSFLNSWDSDGNLIGRVLSSTTQHFAIDSSRNIIVMELEDDGTGTIVVWIRKYAPDETLLWEFEHGENFSGIFSTVRRTVTVDANDNVAFGYSQHPFPGAAVAGGPNIRFFDPDGNLIWSETLNIGMRSPDISTVRDLAFDFNNYLYVVGDSNDTGVTRTVAKLNPSNGSAIWAIHPLSAAPAGDFMSTVDAQNGRNR